MQNQPKTNHNQANQLPAVYPVPNHHPCVARRAGCPQQPQHDVDQKNPRFDY